MKKKKTRKSRTPSRSTKGRKKTSKKRGLLAKKRTSKAQRTTPLKGPENYRSGIERFEEVLRVGRTSQKVPNPRGSATRALNRDYQHKPVSSDFDLKDLEDSGRTRFQDQHDDPVEGPRDDRYYQATWPEDLDLDDAYEYQPGEKDEKEEKDETQVPHRYATRRPRRPDGSRIGRSKTSR